MGGIGGRAREQRLEWLAGVTWCLRALLQTRNEPIASDIRAQDLQTITSAQQQKTAGWSWALGARKLKLFLWIIPCVEIPFFVSSVWVSRSESLQSRDDRVSNT